MAALFIGVTMAFPMGLAGLWESHIKPWWKDRREALRAASIHPPAPLPVHAPPASVAAPGTPSALPDRVSTQSV